MRKALLILTLVGIGAGSVTAFSKVSRSDCPGQVVCPLNGQVICKDRCPAK